MMVIEEEQSKGMDEERRSVERGKSNGKNRKAQKAAAAAEEGGSRDTRVTSVVGINLE